MLKAFLYLWIILTAVLLFLIVWLIINSVKNRKNAAKWASRFIPVEEETPINEEVEEVVDLSEEIVHEEEKEIKVEPDEPVAEFIVVEEIVEEVTVYTDNLVGQSEKKDAENIRKNEEVVQWESNMGENDLAEEVIYEEEKEELKEEESAPVQQTSVTASSYDKSESSADIEIPKNYDANVNIWQWHSRDDIVRDKFEKHIKKIRYDADILKKRNDILWYEKKLVEGLTMLPSDTDFQRKLADLYFHQGKFKKAQSLLKKIIIENPEDHNALWQLGEITSEDASGEEAFAYLQKAYTLCSDNPKYSYTLAQWYYDHDDLESAIPLMEKITKLRPNNIDYLVSLSHMQLKTGDRDGARHSILRALEIEPLNNTLKNYLKALQ